MRKIQSCAVQLESHVSCIEKEKCIQIHTHDFISTFRMEQSRHMRMSLEPLPADVRHCRI